MPSIQNGFKSLSAHILLLILFYYYLSSHFLALNYFHILQPKDFKPTSSRSTYFRLYRMSTEFSYLSYFPEYSTFLSEIFPLKMNGKILQNFQSFSSSHSFILSLRTLIPLFKYSSNLQLFPMDSNFF
ncbi:hypothetical protein LDENG_00292290 [Lucifuga dentata]|nr:hypothetical protein LDENG_00292290 [Lucifuga dentata]